MILKFKDHQKIGNYHVSEVSDTFEIGPEECCVIHQHENSDTGKKVTNIVITKDELKVIPHRMMTHVEEDEEFRFEIHE